jgi:hypothetical protein
VADSTDLSADIAQQATEPVAVTADGQSTTGRGVADLIAAQQFLDARAALAKRRRGMLMTQLTTPGPVHDGGAAVSPVPPFGGGIT